ncbi:hypothetical protein N657DRAFT_233205 [Parathielavia appendiculata]|uniref:Uncharacterized protein n=1 Tax=Parathielavia appendiculata TaxID=2587402 RepID=A0AAN6U7H1_9PEZI|nr:hypothetical protein N657DRAFT_233205 [Parathielavia appendiculata]
MSLKASWRQPKSAINTCRTSDAGNEDGHVCMINAVSISGLTQQRIAQEGPSATLKLTSAQLSRHGAGSLGPRKGGIGGEVLAEVMALSWPGAEHAGLGRRRGSPLCVWSLLLYLGWHNLRRLWTGEMQPRSQSPQYCIIVRRCSKQELEACAVMPNPGPVPNQPQAPGPGPV